VTTLSMILFIASLFTYATSTETNKEKERARVEQVIKDSIGWALDKDKERLYNSVAHDENFFIFHPDAYGTVIGFETFRQRVETVFMSDDFKATSFEVKKLRITFSKSGDVAWFSSLLDDFGEWKGEPAAWVDCRWTGVLEKRESRWVITQMHFSFPQDPDDSEEGETEKES
ncbi:MAG: nuclear transport factor 2 family protein, partial [Planctomycetota bacterium]